MEGGGNMFYYTSFDYARFKALKHFKNFTSLILPQVRLKSMLMAAVLTNVSVPEHLLGGSEG